MPEKKDEAEEASPYASSYGNIIELGEGELTKQKPKDLSKMDTNKMFFDNEKGQYVLNDNMIVRKGYALRVTTFNPGKTDMLDGNGVYSKEVIEKIQKTAPNIKALSQKTIYCDSRNVEDGRSAQSVLMSALDGFNIVRYQVFKFKTNDKGEAIDKDGNLVDDPSKLVLLGKDGKEYIGDDKSNVEAIKEDGAMLFIDAKPVDLTMDRNYFNPTRDNKIYVRKPEFYLRGKIGDKGGFNWEMRVNESVVDNYLIYGDLHIDNTRDFNIKLDVKDGDIMDWGMKDYKANGFPDKVKDMDGNVYLQTGYSNLNAKAVGVHYQFLYDAIKPEIEQKDDGNTAIEYDKDKFIKFNVTDKRDGDKAGEIQDKQIFVNGKEYKSLDDIKDIKDDKLTIKFVVKDFANNTRVKEFSFDKKTGSLTPVDPEKVKITIGNKENELVKGEDFQLPEYKGELPEGKGFKGWKVKDKDGKEKIKAQGSFLFAESDLSVEPDFYELHKEVKEENKQTFDETKKKDEDYSKIWNITCPSDTEEPSDNPCEEPSEEASDADKYEPTVEKEEIEKGGKVDLTDNVTNLDELPEGTTVEDVTPEGAVDTEKPGDYTGKIKVTYPDGSSEEVEVPVTVKDSTSDADKYEPTVEKEEIEKGGTVDLTDNVTNLDELPEGTTVKDVTPEGTIDTNTPGDYTGKVEITYPDGSSEVVDVPVTVKDTTPGGEDPKDPENPGTKDPKDPSKPGADQPGSNNSKEKQDTPSTDSATQANKAGVLPETGEETSAHIFGAAALSILSGLGLVATKGRKEEE